MTPNLSPVYAVECGPEGCGVYVAPHWNGTTSTTHAQTWTDADDASRYAEHWTRVSRGPCRVVTIELSVRTIKQ